MIISNGFQNQKYSIDVLMVGSAGCLNVTHPPEGAAADHVVLLLVDEVCGRGGRGCGAKRPTHGHCVVFRARRQSGIGPILPCHIGTLYSSLRTRYSPVTLQHCTLHYAPNTPLSHWNTVLFTTHPILPCHIATLYSSLNL